MGTLGNSPTRFAEVLTFRTPVTALSFAEFQDCMQHVHDAYIANGREFPVVDALVTASVSTLQQPRSMWPRTWRSASERSIAQVTAIAYRCYLSIERHQNPRRALAWSSAAISHLATYYDSREAGLLANEVMNTAFSAENLRLLTSEVRYLEVPAFSKTPELAQELHARRLDALMLDGAWHEARRLLRHTILRDDEDIPLGLIAARHLSAVEIELNSGAPSIDQIVSDLDRATYLLTIHDSSGGTPHQMFTALRDVQLAWMYALLGEFSTARDLLAIGIAGFQRAGASIERVAPQADRLRTILLRDQ